MDFFLELTTRLPFFDPTDDKCLDKVTQMSELDRYIFLIGGSLTAFITFFLIIGSFRFKQLRKQPGDLVIVIAVTDFILSVHWIVLAAQPTKINDPRFCKVVGAFGVFGGLTGFLYNISFSLYLITTLRNALKQHKTPQIIFHLTNLGLAGVSMFLVRNFIGKTLVGTCSIKSSCSYDFFNYLAPIVALAYCILGISTYLYIRKNSPICANAHKQKTQFLNYYLKYNIMCTLVYFFIATTNILVTSFVLPQTIETGHSEYEWITSLYNVAKLCSPLILSFVRFSDPKIKKVWLRTFCCCCQKKSSTPNALEEPLVEKTKNVGGSTITNEFIFNQLSAKRRTELVYTLLACVVYDNQYLRGLRKKSSTMRTSDEKKNDPFQREEVFQIEDEHIKTDIPEIREELEQRGFNILHGTLKVYSSEVYSEIFNQESDFLDISESLDFQFNKEQIDDASGPGGGKSGEFFFFSRDKKLILKTLPDTEMKIIRSTLKGLNQHFDKNSNSLISKIYGAYTYENTDIGLKFHFILMKNICGFPSKFVERAYDMKGSRYDREVLAGRTIENKSQLKGLVLKDVDFEKYEQKLYIKDELQKAFIDQVKRDSEFLRSVNLIDYSFMVFFVNKEQAKHEIDLSKDITAANQLGSMENLNEPGLYYNMGIIDYLQPFNFQKKMERCLKRAKKLNRKLDTSSQDPDYYSFRFIQFITQLVQCHHNTIDADANIVAGVGVENTPDNSS